MLKNMKAEMVRNGITTEMVMDVLHRSEKTTRDKINGRSDFSFDEAVRVRDALFPGLALEYLFSNNPGADQV